MISRALLDLRGIVQHYYHAHNIGTGDTVVNAVGERVPNAGFAVRGFITKFLTPLLRDFQPINIIGVLEGTGGNDRRRSMFPEYKNKPSKADGDPIMAAEQVKALETVQSLLLGIGAMLVKTAHAEADDTIAFLCKNLHGLKRVYTVDNDLLQLYGRNVELYVLERETGAYIHKTSYKGIQFGEGEPVEAITLYKSLIGDASDGYKGVPKFGEKKFPLLVQAYGWDGIKELAQCAATGDLKPIEDAYKDNQCQLLKMLLENRQSWLLSYNLAVLRPEWCELSWGNKVIRPVWAKRVPEMARVKRALDPVGCGHLAALFQGYCVSRILLDRTYLDGMKDEEIDRLLVQMKNSQWLAYDCETYDTLQHEAFRQAKPGFVDMLHSEVTGGSFCYGPNLQYSFYVSINHRDTANVDKSVLRDFLVETEGARRVAHFAKFEQTVAAVSLGYRFPTDDPPYDTLHMASYVDENEDRGLKRLSKRHLNYDQTSYREVVPAGKDMRDVSGLEVCEYGADDAIVAAHLAVLYQAILESERTWAFFAENEKFFDAAMLSSYLKGIPIDYERMSQLEADDRARFEVLDREVRDLLTDHCGQINEAGFAVLWPEIETFQKATMQRKGKEPDEIFELLAGKAKDVLAACKYQPLVAPDLPLNKSTINAALKSAGLPAARSLEGKRLRDYVTDIHKQAAEQNHELPEHVVSMLDALSELAPRLLPLLRVDNDLIEDEDFSRLRGLVQAVYASDKSLWEGDELNYRSSLQMAQLFYGKMGLPIIVRNKVDKKGTGVRTAFDLEGSPSTNEMAMRAWMVAMEPSDWRFQVLERVLEIRGILIRISLYYSKYPLWQSPTTGHIHPNVRNCGTITRRPSASSPNILQVSKTKDDGRMRSCYLPVAGDEPQLIVSIDWVQQELALLAGLSNDPTLLACYVGDNKKDVHTTTSVGIANITRNKLGLPLWDYDSFNAVRKDKAHPEYKKLNDIRNKRGKNTNFLMSYGGSAPGLARKMIVPIEFAEEIIDAYHRTYPLVKKSQERTINFARRHGYVLSFYGNRKHCPGILSKDKSTASAWQRQAINYGMQGSAADILKMVLKQYVLQNVEARTGATLYAPIYDEVVASVPISKIALYIELMRNIMTIAVPGTPVVLDTSVSIGINWGEQVELEDRTSPKEIDDAICDILDKHNITVGEVNEP